MGERKKSLSLSLSLGRETALSGAGGGVGDGGSVVRYRLLTRMYNEVNVNN